MTDDSRIRLGRIGRPHGVRGEVTVVPETDDRSRFATGSRLVSTEGREFVVADSHPYRDRGLVVAFVGVADRNTAETLRGTVLWGEAADRQSLEPGEFWPDDLAGLVAVAPDGAILGRVSGVDFGVSQDRLVVITPGGSTVLVPFVSALVGDPQDGKIEIRDPGGLF
jgi:16S rRNA processing protein RimM